MKLMIASDIHGSYFFANKLIERFNEEKCDKLIILGDVLYHGPRNDLPKDYDPKKVIDLLNNVKENILCVKGNCDADVESMVLEFPIISDYSCVFCDGKVMYLTHGHTYTKEKPMPLLEGDIFIYGHTHIPDAELKDKILYLNPGSVSIPKAGSQNSYMIYENNNFIWKNTDGEIYKEYKI